MKHFMMNMKGKKKLENDIKLIQKLINEEEEGEEEEEEEYNDEK